MVVRTPGVCRLPSSPGSTVTPARDTSVVADGRYASGHTHPSVSAGASDGDELLRVSGEDLEPDLLARVEEPVEMLLGVVLHHDDAEA